MTKWDANNYVHLWWSDERKMRARADCGSKESEPPIVWLETQRLFGTPKNVSQHSLQRRGKNSEPIHSHWKSTTIVARTVPPATCSERKFCLVKWQKKNMVRRDQKHVYSWKGQNVHRAVCRWRHDCENGFFCCRQNERKRDPDTFGCTRHGKGVRTAILFLRNCSPDPLSSPSWSWAAHTAT